jgi:hypothetical protein
MVTDPKDYPWSSHRAYLGLDEVPWLETATVLSLLSRNASRARTLFEDFVLKRKGEGHRTEFHRGGAEPQLLGGEGFVEDALRRAERIPLKKPSLQEVVEKVMQLYGLGDEDWTAPGQGRRISEARALAAWAVLELSDATLAELGNIVRRDASTLSSSVRRLLLRAGENGVVAGKIQELRNAFG